MFGEITSAKLQRHEGLVSWKHQKVEGFQSTYRTEFSFLRIDCLKSEHISRRSRKIQAFPNTCLFVEHEEFLKEIEEISEYSESKKVLIILPYDNMVDEYGEILKTKDLTFITIATPKDDWQSHTDSCVFVHLSSVKEIAAEKSIINSHLAPAVFKDLSNISDLFIWLDPDQVPILPTF